MRNKVGILLVVIGTRTMHFFCNFCGEYYRTSSLVTSSRPEWKVWQVYEDQIPKGFGLECCAHLCSTRTIIQGFRLFPGLIGRGTLPEEIQI